MDATKFHIVAKLSRINVWNRQSQEKEEMLSARDILKMFCIIVIIRGFIVSFLDSLN